MKHYKILFPFLVTILLFLIPVIFSSSGKSIAAEKGTIFVTWEGVEVDKCASIWLIKRFIDPNAVIKFISKGEIIQEGIPFDIPEAKFRRYYNMSTFESLMKHYELQDSRLLYVGMIIHDIEINIWEQKMSTETHKVQATIGDIIQSSKNIDHITTQTTKYFDSLYEGLDIPHKQSD